MEVSAEAVATFIRMTGKEPSQQAMDDMGKLEAFMHRANGSGPLTPREVGMIALMHDYSPPTQAKAIGQIDWRKVPKGKYVTYERGDQKKDGRYDGLATHGQLVITFHGDPMPREVPPKYVRFADKKDPVVNLPEPAVAE